MSKQHYEYDVEDSSASSTDDAQRRAYEFKVDETNTELPQAITDSHRLPREPDYRGLRLEALPIKGLKALVYSVGLLVLLLMGWQILGLVQAAAAWHWGAALAVMGLVAAVLACSIRSLFSLLSNRKTLSDIDWLQAKAEAISTGSELAQKQNFIDALVAFYQDKPQAALLQESLQSMPDYFSDKEAIDYIEEVFVAPLDTEAQQRVTKYCLQTGIAVAASPWAAMDMLLALWRSLKMIEDVGQVYGIRPSKINRLLLLKEVITHSTLVGATEVIIDRALDEMSVHTLAAKASGQVGQGLGAAIYCARIGLTAMTVSRPIEWRKKPKPGLKNLLVPLINQLTGLFQSKES